MSATIEHVIMEAIHHRQLLQFIYNDQLRLVEPYGLGSTSKGKVALLAIQIGGYSSSGPLPDWRMFEISRIRDLNKQDRKFASYFQLIQEAGKSDVLPALTMPAALASQWEAKAHYHDGRLYWFARDLQRLLGYRNWGNFRILLMRAKRKCQEEGGVPEEHFLVPGRKQTDMLVSYYGTGLLVALADGRKQEVQKARSYFFRLPHSPSPLADAQMVQERVRARQRLTDAEKRLSGVLYRHGVDERGFAAVRSMGDNALFGGYNTARMKQRLGIDKDRPIADFLPTVTIKAKELAAAITEFAVEQQDLYGPGRIGKEHMKHNEEVRSLLINNNIYPEELPQAEDIKRLEGHSARSTIINNI